MARPSKSAVTADDHLCHEEAMMKKLGIQHEPFDTTDTWPPNLRETFDCIKNLGLIEYQSYEETAPARHSTAAWRSDIKLRAKELSDTARRLLRECPSELTWRLEVEKLIDARFRMNTECSICSSRLWRSEVEVVTQSKGPITMSLESRRKLRVPCQCGDTTYIRLNPLFSNRADQVFHYGPHPELSQSSKNLTKRSPDRVYGLRQTSNLEELLGKPAQSVLDDANETSIAAVRDAIDSDIEETLVRDFIQTSPYNRRPGDPLLFPFLIMEAKSEHGPGFSRCGTQTSIPIWTILRGQEKLSERGAPLSELGGPIVWYIAYQGDGWRLSGCYPLVERGKKKYIIQDLWDGRICTPDGALQILLMIDYIVDWARDLYRPSILRSLGAIADPDYDDSASIAADSDIYSTRKNPNVDGMTEVESNFGTDNLETSTTDDSLLEPWKKHDYESARGFSSYDIRAFRPSYVIKSAFQCLNITGDSIGTLIASLGGNPQTHTRMARDALAALRTGPMILTERVLSHIEDTWTGTIRTNRHAGIGDRKFCSIAYRLSISDSWELTRAIVCFAVDQSGLDKLRQHSRLKRKSFCLTGIEDTAQVVSENAVTAVLQSLKSRDDKEILSHAMFEINEVWLTENLLSRLERAPLGPLAEGTIILKPGCWAGGAIANIVYGTYKRHRQPGYLEPDFPYLRFSARLEQSHAKSSSAVIPMLPLKIGREPPKLTTESILLCRQNRNGKHLCIFTTKAYPNPPKIEEMVSALATASLEQRFFILKRYRSHRDGTGKGEVFSFSPNPTVESNEVLNPIILYFAMQWILKLCQKLDKELSRECAAVLGTNSLETAGRKLSGMMEELYIGRMDRPFHPSSLKPPPPPKRRTPIFVPQTPPETPVRPASTMGYSRESEIEAILAQAEGDGLTDGHIHVLTQLGYFT